MNHPKVQVECWQDDSWLCIQWKNVTDSRDGHQNLKLFLIDLNQMHLIGLVERTILVFESSKSDVSLQSYGL